ncbi:hypothetical protein SAY87_009991 [Trapa incisa]|uniref:Uncharacterized protein n=1 Tax=Trapa incisa TaxID=236973 RepID=A0AAN7JH87_9MYRT|nr:hypothetical protein SAY87_009991 [Trapa incisa]
MQGPKREYPKILGEKKISLRGMCSLSSFPSSSARGCQEVDMGAGEQCRCREALSRTVHLAMPVTSGCGIQGLVVWSGRLMSPILAEVARLETPLPTPIPMWRGIQTLQDMLQAGDLEMEGRGPMDVYERRELQ